MCRIDENKKYRYLAVSYHNLVDLKNVVHLVMTNLLCSSETEMIANSIVALNKYNWVKMKILWNGKSNI